MDKDNKYKIKVLEKAFSILGLFDEKGKEFTATEIAELLKFNKASTFRVIKNLENGGYLEKDPHALKYRLGIKLYYLGSLVEPHAKIKEIARPFLGKLNDECDETVHLTILHQGEALYLHKIEGKKTIRVISRVGWKLPAHCSGVGKVLLASLPEEELENIIKEKGLPRLTDNTITDSNALKAELARVRSQGYAIDNEEIEEGLKCAAAPLCDSRGKVVAAISISGPKERFNKEISTFISKVMETAQKISDVIRQQMQDKDYRS